MRGSERKVGRKETTVSEGERAHVRRFSSGQRRSLVTMRRLFALERKNEEDHWKARLMEAGQGNRNKHST